jgi:hypothetical protein
MTRVRQANWALLAIAALMMLPAFRRPVRQPTGGPIGFMAASWRECSKSPHTIVVKTPLSKHNDMTVGAKVTAQTKIMRKGKRISIQHVSVGEVVWLTYVKQRDGLFARVIQVQ